MKTFTVVFKMVVLTALEGLLICVLVLGISGFDYLSLVKDNENINILLNTAFGNDNVESSLAYEDNTYKGYDVDTRFICEGDVEYSVGGASVECGNIDTIMVDWDEGQIEIKETDDTAIRITETEQSSDDYMLRYRVVGNALDIRFIGNGVETNGVSKNITVSIPKKCANSLQAIQLDVKNTIINISNIKTKDVIIFADGNSHINIENCDSYLTQLEALSGKFNYSGKLSNFYFTTNGSCDITCTLTQAPEIVDIKSDSGNATINLPSDIKGFEVKYHMVEQGVFNTDFKINPKTETSDSINTVYGDGSSKISFVSGFGDLSILKSKND